MGVERNFALRNLLVALLQEVESKYPKSGSVGPTREGLRAMVRKHLERKGFDLGKLAAGLSFPKPPQPEFEELWLEGLANKIVRVFTEEHKELLADVVLAA